ncbi:hypothetical protein RND71_027709 [Anisodus tanguticus]|uniref:At1g61320/AtMIF1 LRR domain-containing protein n=1 Tax=Anisodus tanguticus TaxID=243964 RepID=A0AAE1RJF9_9SOLA|nr:hypothetical protein RND71_027709 [Anisodus tanguticus]
MSVVGYLLILHVCSVAIKRIQIINPRHILAEPTKGEPLATTGDPMECKIDKLQNELLVDTLSYLSVKEVAREFMKLVNQVLKWHQGPTLEQFRVGFIFNGSCFTIDHWIRFAIQKEVKLFELNLAAGLAPDVGWSYSYFPDIEKLSSGDIGKLKFSRFCCNLKSLSLVDVHVKEEIVHFFLSNCPHLEQICISGSKCLENLKVTGPLPSLKSMEISYCFNVKGLEVDASNLESFTYIGPDILVPFQNAPQLSELTIGQEYCYSFIFYADKHASYSSKLRKLKLMVPHLVAMWRSSSTFSYPDNFPRLDNLRELELDLKLEAGESLLFFTFFSKASPFLSSFTARITYIQVLAEKRISDVDDVEHAARLATRFVHKNLKVVKLIGFIGCRSDFNLALHLLEIGGSLKEIILQPTNDCHHPNFMSVASIEERSKELESKLPPGAKLITKRTLVENPVVGLVKLHRDVRKCEYEDVNILWEMLKKNETGDATKSAAGPKKVRFWDIIDWAKRDEGEIEGWVFSTCTGLDSFFLLVSSSHLNKPKNLIVPGLNQVFGLQIEKWDNLALGH